MQLKNLHSFFNKKKKKLLTVGFSSGSCQGSMCCGEKNDKDVFNFLLECLQVFNQKKFV